MEYLCVVYRFWWARVSRPGPYQIDLWGSYSFQGRYFDWYLIFVRTRIFPERRSSEVLHKQGLVRHAKTLKLHTLTLLCMDISTTVILYCFSADTKSRGSSYFPTSSSNSDALSKIWLDLKQLGQAGFPPRREAFGLQHGTMFFRKRRFFLRM